MIKAATGRWAVYFYPSNLEVKGACNLHLVNQTLLHRIWILVKWCKRMRRQWMLWTATLSISPSCLSYQNYFLCLQPGTLTNTENGTRNWVAVFCRSLVRWGTNEERVGFQELQWGHSGIQTNQDDRLPGASRGEKMPMKYNKSKMVVNFLIATMEVRREGQWF